MLIFFLSRLRRSNGVMLVAGLDKVDPCWAPNGGWGHSDHLSEIKP